MVQDIDIIKVVCQVVGKNIESVRPNTKMIDLSFDDYDRAKLLIGRLQDVFGVDITFYMISNCLYISDLIKCVLLLGPDDQNFFCYNDDDFYKNEKTYLLSILKSGNGSEIIKLQSSLKEMRDKLEKYTKDLKDSSAPVEQLEMSKFKFLNSVMSPTREDVIIVVNAVCDIIKDVAMKLGDSIALQSNGITSLSEIIRNVICLEADLYNLLSEGSTVNNEAIQVLKDWCNEHDINGELFESLITKTDQRVKKQRERLGILEQKLEDKIDFIDNNYKTLLIEIENTELKNKEFIANYLMRVEKDSNLYLETLSNKLNGLSNEVKDNLRLMQYNVDAIENVDKRSDKLSKDTLREIFSIRNNLRVEIDQLAKDVYAIDSKMAQLVKVQLKSTSFIDSAIFKLIIASFAIASFGISIYSIL